MIRAVEKEKAIAVAGGSAKDAAKPSADYLADTNDS
jgi:hypothetical protein